MAHLTKATDEDRQKLQALLLGASAAIGVYGFFGVVKIMAENAQNQEGGVFYNALKFAILPPPFQVFELYRMGREMLD